MAIIRKDAAKVELKEGMIEVRAETVEGWNVAFERWPPGDYSPLFHGLPGNACSAAHYGYCLKGKGTAVFNDHEEHIQAGQAYVLRPGHTFRVEETLEMVEFTPLTPEYAEVGEAFMKNFPKWMAAARPR
ncbi:MAG TPA: hypothetical protein VGB18_03730 [Candidatus Thermoplasmatota archaeon]